MSSIKRVPPQRAVEKERSEFLSLIKQNPNYFGNLPKSTLKAVIKIISNKTYEEITCAGLYTDVDYLEAIVYIKKEAGYGGGLCTQGTREYVRFFLSWDNGATWQDQGMTFFTAWDVKGKKSLECAVKLHISPEKKKCIIENLPKMRAILSWNFPPPAGNAFWTPVWGNVYNGRVQIKALKPEPGGAEGAVKSLSAEELQTIYKPHNIPAKRYLYPVLQKLKKADEPFTPNLAVENVSGLEGLAINIPTIINELVNTDGSTFYEELGCVGLDTMMCVLEATVKVKKPYGYLGGLCTKGSTEYVAFWIDFGTGAGWEYVGTAKLNTHDIKSIPREGLDYAVFQGNVPDRRKHCQEGSITAKVRAILSWETPPPPANPNWIPVWGNREETLVLIPPLEAFM